MVSRLSLKSLMTQLHIVSKVGGYARRDWGDTVEIGDMGDKVLWLMDDLEKRRKHVHF